MDFLLSGVFLTLQEVLLFMPLLVLLLWLPYFMLVPGWIKTLPRTVFRWLPSEAAFWFGWYGFNAGSEVAVDFITSLAFLNTDIAASFATIAWLFVEWIRERKPKFVGLLTGSIAGLATITPCAGFVPLWASPIIGIAAGLVCYLAVQFKNKMKWDDALDVWGVHGVGGVLGTILLGVFASKAINAAGADGLIFGGSSFLVKQIVAVVGASVYAFIFTYFMLIIINILLLLRFLKELKN